MPILPPSVVAPYDSLNSVLDLARVYMDDAIQNLDGEVMKNSNPFFQVAVNGGWRVMCEFGANMGYTRFISEVLIQNCPRVASLDPASQTNITWTGFFDGSNYYDTPALPQDFISPLKMWERQTGQNIPFPIHPNMENFVDGLPAQPKRWRNYAWEWREDGIWMPGSLYSMDLRIRYAKYLGDFVTVGDPANDNGTWWYNQPVPVMRCQSPLAKFICYVVAFARGDEQASVFKSEGEAEMKLVFNRDARAKLRVNIRRQGRSGRGHGNYDCY